MYSASSYADYNIGIGNQTLTLLNAVDSSLTYGTMNIAIGNNAMESSSLAQGNIAIGYKSQQSQSNGRYNVSIGWESFTSAVGIPPFFQSNYNVVIGALAAYKPLFAYTSVIAGYKAFYATNDTEIVYDSVHIGAYASEHLKSSVENIGIGAYTLWGNEADSTLRYNIALGHEAARYLASGSEYNFFGGYRAGYMRGPSSTIIPGKATSTIAIGNYTAVSQSLLNSSILIGTDVLRESESGTVNNGPIEDVIYIGHGSGKYSYNEGPDTHKNSIAIGNYSQEHITNERDSYNISIGNKSLRKNKSGEYLGENIVIGHEAAESASMQYSIAVGNLAQKWVYGKYNVSVGQSTFMGYDYTDLEPSLTQSRNVFVGDEVAKNSIALLDNVGIGYQALSNAGKLSRHIAIGAYALNNADNNVGAGYSELSSSIAIGYKSMYSYIGSSNAIDGANIALGEYSLGDTIFTRDTIAIGFETARGADGQSPQSDKSIAIGSYNLHKFESIDSIISVGYKGLYNFVSGSDLISIGNSALYNYISGSKNIAIGNESLYTNETGTYNIAIGNKSMYSSSVNLSNNIAVGVESQYYNFANNEVSTEVSGNISYGHYSLRNITYGRGNIAVGYKSMYGNSDLTASLFGPLDNIAVGNYALHNVYSASQNIAVGNYALEQNAFGDYNVAIGGYALNRLSAQTESVSNIAIGYRAAFNVQSASNDVVIGREALNSSVSQGENVIIGSLAGNFKGTLTNNEYGDIIQTSTVSPYYSVLIGNSNSFNSTGSNFEGVISIGAGSLIDSRIESTFFIPVAFQRSPGILVIGGDSVRNHSRILTGLLAIGNRIAATDLNGTIDNSLLVGNGILELANLGNIQPLSKAANVLAIGHNIAEQAEFLMTTESFSEGVYYEDTSILTAIGYRAFSEATSSTSNLGIGSYVGAHSTGKFNLFVGNSVAFDSNGDNNVVIGNESFNLGVGILAEGINNTPQTVLLGQRQSSSNNNTVVGNYTLRNAIANNVTSIGYNNLDLGFTQRLGEAMYGGLDYYVSSVSPYAVTASNVVTIGNKIGRYSSFVTNSIMIGDFVGGDVHGFDKIIAIGNYSLGAYDYATELALVPSVTDGTAVTHSNNLSIGHYSSYYLKNGEFNTAIGNEAYYNAYDRIGNSLFGNESGYHLGQYERLIGESIECGTGNYNTFGGYLSGWGIGKVINGANLVAAYTAPVAPGNDPLPTVYYTIDTSNAAGTPDRNTIFGSDALPNLYNACLPFPTINPLVNSSRSNSDAGNTPSREQLNALWQSAVLGFFTDPNSPAPTSITAEMLSYEQGNLNVAVGYKSGFELVAGGKNVYIGAGAEGGIDWENKETKNGPTEYRNGNNNIVIGFNAHKSDPIMSNEITIGNPNHEAARLVGQMGAWLYPSDARDKTDTGSFNVGLDFIKSLNPKSYKWDSRYNYASGSGSDGSYTSSNYYIGFIAQEFYESVQTHIEPDYRAPWFNLAKQIRKDNSEYYDVIEIAPTLTIVPLVNAVKELSQYVTGSATGSYTGSFTGSMLASEIVVDSLYQKSNILSIDTLDQASYSNKLFKAVNGYTSGSNPTGSAGRIAVRVGLLESESIQYPDLAAMNGVCSGYLTATRIDSGSEANVYRYNFVTRYENNTLSIITESISTVYQDNSNWNIDFKVESNNIVFYVYGESATEISWANNVEFNYTSVIRRSESTGCTTCNYTEVFGFSPTKITIDQI